MSVSCFGGEEGEINAFALLYFVKIWGLDVSRLNICGCGYIHGYPRKICRYGYGYGWEILYPRQAKIDPKPTT